MSAGETALDAVGEGMRIAADDAEAAKSTVAPEGPGRYMQPAPVQPEQFGRNYIEAGHASEAPAAQPPRQNPMPNMTHAVLPTAPMAARIHPAAIAHYTSGSPSER